MKRFQRPISQYSGAEDLLYRDKYQQDSKSVPKIAISSSKMDGDFNYLTDAINTLDEDIKSVVHSGIANQTIEEKHIADFAISETKIAEESINCKALKPGSVTNAKLADLAITTAKIANNSVTKDKMATDSVGTDEVVDKSITRDKLADNAISDSVPVGAIAQFSVQPLPTGWILCNGATVSKNTYPQLVKFLTNSDVTLSVTLPNLNTDQNALTKFAIKAFSDTIELANLEVAGLTQDVADNSAEINSLKEKGSQTELWKGNTAGGTIMLSEAMDNFEYLLIYAYDSQNNCYLTPAMWDKSMYVDNALYSVVADSQLRLNRINSNSFSIPYASYRYLKKIIGVK